MTEMRQQAIAVLVHYGLLESANLVRAGVKLSEVLKGASMNPLLNEDQKSKLSRLGNLAHTVEVCQQARQECESLKHIIEGK